MATYTDPFTRANSGSLGANWTDLVGGFGIASNGAYSTTSADNFSVWNATWGNNHYSQAKYLTSPDAYVGPGVRMSGVGIVLYVGYNLYINPNGAGWQVQRAPGFSTILSGGDTFNNADIAKFNVTGTTLTAYKAGVSIGSTTDAVIATGGAGIISYTVSVHTTIPELDDWEGSDGGGGITAVAVDTISLSDSAVSISQRISIGTDTISFSDSAVSITSRISTASDTFSPSDSAVSTTTRLSVATDTISFSDSADAATGIPVVAADTIAFSDSAVSITSRLSVASDTLSLSDSADSFTTRLSIGVDSLSLSDSAISGVIFPSAAADTIAFSDSAVAIKQTAGTSVAVDTISFSDSALSVSSRICVASDSINFSDSASRQGSGLGPVQGTGVFGTSYRVQGRGVQGIGTQGVRA